MQLFRYFCRRQSTTVQAFGGARYRRTWRVLPAILVCGLSGAYPAVAAADAYDAARAKLVAAYQAQDFVAMRVAANDALLARPGYPAARFNLALAAALAGDSEEALAVLSALVASGVDYDITANEEFAALRQAAGWPAYAAAVAELQQPVGRASVAFTYDVGDFVPEGILLLDDELVLGSVRHGQIVRIGERVEVLSDARTAGHWSVFGMRLGPDDGIWFATAAVPEYAAIDAGTLGTTGLFRLDPESGVITERAILPRGDAPMVLGDLVFVDDDTIYLTESLQGALYRYTISARRLEQVVAPGALRSMQGLVPDQSGTCLYVADYVGGLFRIDLADFAVARVTADPAINLFGIDGLYRHGDELIAIQNGIHPQRVVALQLAADGRSISALRVLARNLAEFDEPTLGTVAGDDFLFVANSHWNRFDQDAQLPADLQGPIILRISLRQP